MIIIWRLMLPETNYYQVIRSERDAREKQNALDRGDTSHQKANDLKAFLKNANKAMRQNWVLFVRVFAVRWSPIGPSLTR